MQATENQKLKMKEYYRSNKKRVREVHDIWLEKNQSQGLYNSCRNRAKKENLEFNIELSDIIIPEICPLLKVKLTNTRGKGKVDTNASIDRKDSSKGYVKGNVWVISHLANRMKNSATREQLITFAFSILGGPF